MTTGITLMLLHLHPRASGRDTRWGSLVVLPLISGDAAGAVVDFEF